MHFHKWSNWERIIITTIGDFLEERQQRICLKCNKTQRERL
jgi:hypothetical protein